MNQIVYVDDDGNIFTIAADGTVPRRLTGNDRAGSKGIVLGRVLQQDSVFYTWPTWSPDGEKLAVSQVVVEEDTPIVSLFIMDPSTGRLSKVYQNEPQSSPIIASNIPHYMYWSPDSSHLVFSGTLSPGSAQGNGSGPNTDKIYVINTESGSPPKELASGPLAFWSWN